MTDERANRAVVFDEVEDSTQKTEADVEKENADLEKALSAKKEDVVNLDQNLLKKLKEKVKSDSTTTTIKSTTRRDRSIYFGIVGVGQAGSRVAETFYKLGYEGCVFNTAQQDLEFIDLPNNKKVFLPYAIGGAGRELDNGRMAIENNAEAVLNKLGEVFSDRQEIILLAVSGGGGTGSGGAEAMLGLLATLGKPICVMYILPMASEDALSKHNSVVTLSKLAKMTSSNSITSLIVIDNSKIELIYPNLSKSEFWKTANNAIVEPLHLFNTLSSTPTNHDALDPMDFSRVLTEGDCMIYGMIKVEDYTETTAIAEAVISNLEAGLLASDFDLTETRFVGYIITASKKVLSKLPAVNIQYASHMISEKCNSPKMVSGVYEIETDEDVVNVYTILGGLGLPAKRIDDLKNEASAQMAVAKEKEKMRAGKMSVEYGGTTETQTKTEEIHRLINQKKSAFGQLTNNARKIVDKRRR